MPHLDSAAEKIHRSHDEGSAKKCHHDNVQCAVIVRVILRGRNGVAEVCLTRTQLVARSDLLHRFLR
ncbi:hypothetical protein EVAR_64782_1 [Eumeta japonica]|uniref:Uncharacterized protein n=1 Tax=Eumeta variegata TaxID=151549 RepID=A0A4C1ZRP1_EUMVA|nr:hypothetical protein EVAR_64782_1 [Eumeta japonica]